MVRACSARMRRETSASPPGNPWYVTPVARSAAAMSGWKTSMSQIDSAPCRTARLRSRPAPVSMLGRGSGTRVPSGCASNVTKTRFQIST